MLPSAQLPCAETANARWYRMLMWLLTIAFCGFVAIIATLSSIHLFYANCDYAKPWNTWMACVAVTILIAGAAWLGHRVLLRPSNAKWMLAIFLFSLALRVLCVTQLPYSPGKDFRVYHEAGVTMANTWTLGIHATDGDSYRAFFAPGQVFTLGVLYKVFQNDNLSDPSKVSVLPAQLFNALLAALTVLGIYLIARRMLNEHMARVASILAALLPSSVFACMVLGAEVPETFWLVLAMWIYVQWVDSQRSWKAAILCGLALGVGSLIRPTYILLPVAMGLHMLIVWRSQRLRAVGCVAAIGVGIMIAVLPWTYRNYQVTGGFILVSSNGGGNLWSGNNDWTRHGMYTDQTWDWLFKNCRNDIELQQKGMAKAKEWIKAHPGRFCRLAVEKFVVLWLWDQDMAWWALQQPIEGDSCNPNYDKAHVEPQWALVAMADSTAFFAALLMMATAGLLRMRKMLQSRTTWILLMVLTMYFSSLHMVFETQAKYHYMMVPLFCIWAAMFAGRKDADAPPATCTVAGGR